MQHLFWGIPCGIYWALAWVAGKRKETADAARCFLDGYFLALLCFCILPFAMKSGYFYGAVLLSALGVIGGVLLEKGQKMGALTTAFLFTAVTAFYFMQKSPLSAVGACALAFFGGIGLYAACCGILPEEIPLRKQLLLALLGGSGFLLGTAYFGGFFC
ncbi:MAG: hypothetical protein IKI88_03305 [Anaerotignum sp.]|nr:hypothetical protein [Anaerotignum sp.]